jgi:hypothetical protein
MAKLVHRRSPAGDSYVTLEAQEEEEVSPEMVMAWATLHQSVAVEQLANNLASVSDELSRIANNLTDLA